MSAKKIATLCIEDLQSKLQGLPEVAAKTFWVYDEADLFDTVKQLQFPATGVVYEGIRAVSETDKSSGRQGISGELIASVALLILPGIKGSASVKVQAVDFLDQMRNTIMGTRSPTGHLWKFVVEAAATEKNGAVVWLQRWSTPIQLVPVVR